MAILFDLVDMAIRSMLLKEIIGKLKYYILLTDEDDKMRSTFYERNARIQWISSLLIYYYMSLILVQLVHLVFTDIGAFRSNTHIDHYYIGPWFLINLILTFILIRLQGHKIMSPVENRIDHLIGVVSDELEVYRKLRLYLYNQGVNSREILLYCNNPQNNIAIKFNDIKPLSERHFREKVIWYFLEKEVEILIDHNLFDSLLNQKFKEFQNSIFLYAREDLFELCFNLDNEERKKLEIIECNIVNQLQMP